MSIKELKQFIKGSKLTDEFFIRPCDELWYITRNKKVFKKRTITYKPVKDILV